MIGLGEFDGYVVGRLVGVCWGLVNFVFGFCALLLGLDYVGESLVRCFWGGWL